MATRLDEMRRELNALGVTNVDDESEEWCAGYLPVARALARRRADAAGEFRTDSPTPRPAPTASTQTPPPPMPPPMPVAAAPTPPKPKRVNRRARLDAAAYEASFPKPDETADQYHARTGAAAQASEKLQAEQKLRAGTPDVYAEAYAASFKNGGRP